MRKNSWQCSTPDYRETSDRTSGWWYVTTSKPFTTQCGYRQAATHVYRDVLSPDSGNVASRPERGSADSIQRRRKGAALLRDAGWSGVSPGASGGLRHEPSSLIGTRWQRQLTGQLRRQLSQRDIQERHDGWSPPL
ncbi:hypothetical protein DPMN_172104 [Dreissena polymorpha]|uniref:Uncharacterized protein n=1 Tax=Dreissena polymorpha TaxID=45954 RepID=A0A9D4IES7_DREPO|nr:hypothetical protein DPMN_172104 [Dreissena polymorpha]